MTERQARLAPARWYLDAQGRIHEIQGVAHLEDETGKLEIATADGTLTLTRVDFERRIR